MAKMSPPDHVRRRFLLACGGLLLLFGILSYSAVLQKSATYDEPLQTLSAWCQFRLGDFRINYEHPPLPNYWAAIPNAADAIEFDPNNVNWTHMPQNPYLAWQLSSDVLYHTPANDADALINRSRFMMLLQAMALAALVMTWAWQLGGPVAALVAGCFFCLDPNLLGHGSLVKNDLPIALMTTAVILVCWRIGNRVTLFNTLLLGILIPAALTTKFSALLLGPILFVLIGIRVALPIPWIVLGRTISRFRDKFAVAVVLMMVAGLCCYAGIWLAYGFRFNPSSDPAIRLTSQMHRAETVLFTFEQDHPRPWPALFDPKVPPDEAITSYAAQLDVLSRATTEARAAAQNAQMDDSLREQVQSLIQLASTLQANATQLLNNARQFTNMSAASRPSDYPQQLVNMCARLHDVQISMQNSAYQMDFVKYSASLPEGSTDPMVTVATFLLDHHAFPSAWLHGLMLFYARSRVRGAYLFGTVSSVGWWYFYPLAMLFKMPLATVLSLLTAALAGIWTVKNRWNQRLSWLWPLVCLVVPFAIFLSSAMASNLNIGIRLVFPLYPLMYITAGLMAAMAWKRWQKRATILASVLGLALLAETCAAWPNYIAFFNVFAAPYRFLLLGDSNLDWGQDLPLLQKWQQAHPDAPLALAYFGTADPKFYGIVSSPLPYWPPPEDLKQTHVMAVSATLLQGIYGGGYNDYRKLPHTQILGGTIYLYDLRADK